MTHYDIALIGTGSGNMVIDSRFDDKSIVIVEKGQFGGTCLNRGCIPSKMLAYTTEVADTVAGSERFDVSASDPDVHWKALRERVFGRLDENEASGREGREKSDNITVLAGTGTFTGPRALRVRVGDDDIEITADKVVVAVGGHPVVPPPIAKSGVRYHTSDDIMRLDEAPRRLLVLGGGYIAAELAHVFAATGAHITVVESSDNLLGPHDESVTEAFTSIAQQRYDVRLGTSVTGAHMSGDDIVLELDDGSEVTGDTLLVAAGRKPNTDDLGCEHAGIDVDEDSGRIVVDDQQRTSADGVYALGDVSSPIPLKHVANREAKTVAHNLANPSSPIATDHDLVPSAVFTEPQIGSIGKTEQQLRDAGTRYTAGRKDYSDVAYGWAMEDTTGFCKILADPASGKILGAHVFGPQAASLVHVLVVAMQFDIDARRLASDTYWAHPALTEIIENTLNELELD
ncbi:mycothione reductase [Rhodococcoides trifolii]|uniref:Mycothione reductase n=1 Tax=Rhodococcoides trifolii TaxID=908250 RepID=A0A917CYF1_9NOCA|nr:mycothione reductase [Rhodococcus trifolii]GGG02735.1 mycothione reductase [Rhodococcus trifolii]